MTSNHARAERHFREIVAAAGIAEPDHVEHSDTQLAFFWDAQRVVVVVDLAEGEALSGDDLDELGVLH